MGKSGYGKRSFLPGHPSVQFAAFEVLAAAVGLAWAKPRLQALAYSDQNCKGSFQTGITVSLISIAALCGAVR